MRKRELLVGVLSGQNQSHGFFTLYKMKISGRKILVPDNFTSATWNPPWGSPVSVLRLLSTVEDPGFVIQYLEASSWLCGHHQETALSHRHLWLA